MSAEDYSPVPPGSGINSPTTGDPGRRLSVSLTGENLQAVKAIAARSGVPDGEVVRRAIALMKFLDEAEQRGAVLRLQETPASESERVHFLFA